jgi:hypothetical protein
LPKCGEHISYAIACSDVLADALVDLVNPQYTSNEASQRRTQWRNSLLEYLRTDPERRLGRIYNTVISSLASYPTFPSINIVGLYLDPVANGGPPTISWDPKAANIGTIVRFCERSFSWGTRRLLFERFSGSKNLWPSLVRSAFLLVRLGLFLLMFGFTLIPRNSHPTLAPFFMEKM